MSQSMFDIREYTRDICTNSSINTTDFSCGTNVWGPGIYLVKLLVWKFGFSCLKQISNILSWIIPEELSTIDPVCGVQRSVVDTVQLVCNLSSYFSYILI